MYSQRCGLLRAALSAGPPPALPCAREEKRACRRDRHYNGDVLPSSAVVSRGIEASWWYAAPVQNNNARHSAECERVGKTLCNAFVDLSLTHGDAPS